MKERELKLLKFKTLLDTPAEEKRESSNEAAAQSARATFLGRSVTKTSDDFKRLSLVEDSNKKDLDLSV